MGTYIVTIGEPFNGGAGCDGIFNAINAAIEGFQNPKGQWVSVGDDVDDVNTQLAIVALPAFEGPMNAALGKQYPAVASGFGCCLNCATPWSGSIPRRQ
ncbi:hypothetical protein LTR36_005262 [Oleoguttula mirabilis]|uniref:Uncharacterized protein n=1 Tax=Oleoguttula mirabilis TaxID=1507867 RepID=A0AAV9JFD0_9PEZI|nr:hypothetical protein LTR36_005262 [Oleoguttula mirabilis]